MPIKTLTLALICAAALPALASEKPKVDDKSKAPAAAPADPQAEMMKKEYANVWLDSMSTTIGAAAGQYDAASKTIKDEGSFACPMTGEKNKRFRAEWTLAEGGPNTYTMYTKDSTGQEFKSMEIVYTRPAPAAK